MGNNLTASRYSGVKTDSIIMIVSVLTGLMAGFTALFLTSRMGSTRPNVAQGYELEVIAMVVLGGVSTSGGKGRMAGPLLAIFIIGFLNYGLGLVNIQAQTLLIIVGLLLILSVLVLNVRFRERYQGSVPSAARERRRGASRTTKLHKEEVLCERFFIRAAVITAIMAIALPVALFASGGGEKPAAGGAAKYAIVFKNTGNPYGDKQMGGFKAGIEEQGFQAILRAPDQPTAEAQIQILEQLISQKVAAICIVGNDKDALQPVLTKAKNQGIKVFSLDSASTRPAA